VGPRPVNVMSLCSGIGGLDLGVRRAVSGARTVVLVEREAYACEVLASRIDEGSVDPAPCWTDLRTFDGRPWRGVVDLVVAGVPCQPVSHAGKRGGSADERWLWPDFLRIVAECRPLLVFWENVPGIISKGLREILSDLDRLGYVVDGDEEGPSVGLFSAEEVGGSHLRERVFCLAWDALADDDDDGRQGERRGRLLDVLRQARGGDAHGSCREDVADRDGQPHERRGAAWHVACPPPPPPEGNGSQRERLRDAAHDRESPLDDDDEGLEGRARREGPPGTHAARHGGGVPVHPPLPDDRDGWDRVLAVRPDLAPSLEPEVLGVAHGVSGGMVGPERIDRLRSLGNAVVPAVAEHALRVLARRAAGGLGAMESGDAREGASPMGREESDVAELTSPTPDV